MNAVGDLNVAPVLPEIIVVQQLSQLRHSGSNHLLIIKDFDCFVVDELVGDKYRRLDSHIRRSEIVGEEGRLFVNAHGGGAFVRLDNISRTEDMTIDGDAKLWRQFVEKGAHRSHVVRMRSFL